MFRARLSSSAPALLVGLVGLVGGLSGCAGSYPRLSFAVEQRLLRETTLDDMPEHEAAPGDNVVRVIRTGGAAGACSGALIGRRHVLTAQHCVVQLDSHHELTMRKLSAGEMHVELGGDYLPWGRVGVREVHTCDGYTHDIDHDVAVLVLSKRVPDAVRSFELSYETPDEAGVFALSGYGTNLNPRVIPFTDWSISSVTRHMHRGPVFAVNDGNIFARIDGAPGDSGGPILDTSTGQIVAVVSKGGAPGGNESKSDTPVVAGPRLGICRTTIETALLR